MIEYEGKYYKITAVDYDEQLRKCNFIAKKYKKQVIITTHNPAILDGLNINDENQRLFIARRNKKGKTQIERIKQKTKSKMRL